MTDLFQFSFDRDTQIFFVGAFAAIMTIWPLIMLIMVPHDVFLAKNVLIKNAERKAAQAIKENEKLRLELIDHMAIIDALLKEKMK